MDDLARLLAIEDIKQLKARYFRAVDQKDRGCLRSVFAEDAVVDYRGAATDTATGINAVPDSTESVLHGAEAVVESVMTSIATLVSVHHASVPEITIKSDTTAEAIWPMVDRLRLPPGAPITELVGYGYYYETYERAGGVWKIKTLRLTRLRVDITQAAAAPK